MLESVWYGTSRSGERRTKWPYVSFSQRSLSSAISGLPFERLCRLRLTAEKVSGDDELLDLRGPLVELGDLGVAEVPLHGVFRDEAVAAVDLDGVRGHTHGHLGGEELGHGRLGPVGQLAVLQESRPPREEPGRLDARGHVGQHPL